MNIFCDSRVRVGDGRTTYGVVVTGEDDNDVSATVGCDVERCTITTTVKKDSRIDTTPSILTNRIFDSS